MKPVVLAVALVILCSGANHAQSLDNVLNGIQTVSVTPTVVSDGRKVKDPSAGGTVETALRNALIASGIRVGDSPIRMHMSLDEFTAGSAAKRALIGFGSGRSTVSARLIVERDGEPMATVAIKTRGRLMFSAYQGDDSQQRHALNEFEQRLVEVLATLR